MKYRQTASRVTRKASGYLIADVLVIAEEKGLLVECRNVLAGKLLPCKHLVEDDRWEQYISECDKAIESGDNELLAALVAEMNYIMIEKIVS